MPSDERIERELPVAAPNYLPDAAVAAVADSCAALRIYDNKKPEHLRNA